MVEGGGDTAFETCVDYSDLLLSRVENLVCEPDIRKGVAVMEGEVGDVIMLH